MKARRITWLGVTGFRGRAAGLTHRAVVSHPHESYELGIGGSMLHTSDCTVFSLRLGRQLCS